MNILVVVLIPDVENVLQTADRICNFNRHYAEFAGYWTTTNFLKEVKNLQNLCKLLQESNVSTTARSRSHCGVCNMQVDMTGETTYYDSVTGKPLFIAPRGRSASFPVPSLGTRPRVSVPVPVSVSVSPLRPRVSRKRAGHSRCVQLAVQYGMDCADWRQCLHG